jgi:hypothetical protein
MSTDIRDATNRVTGEALEEWLEAVRHELPADHVYLDDPEPGCEDDPFELLDRDRLAS